MAIPVGLLTPKATSLVGAVSWRVKVCPAVALKRNWMVWFGLMSPIIDVVVWPGGIVIRWAGGFGVCGVSGTAVAPTAPAEFLGTLTLLPVTNPPGFTFCSTVTSALYCWAIEAHVSPPITVWKTTQGLPQTRPTLPMRGTVSTMEGRMKFGFEVTWRLASRTSSYLAP